MNIKILIYIFILSTGLLVGCSNKSDDNPNQNYSLEIKPVDTKSTFEKVFPYIKDSLSVLAVFLGIFITYPLLRKKLVENHISDTLKSIQDTNRKIQSDCQKLIDKYVPLTYSSEFLREVEIENVYNEIRKLYYESQQSSSDVVTILFYLKNTYQGILKHYDYGKYAIITSRDLYGLTISILELTVFYCSKVVQIPKSTKIEQSNMINPKLKKFVTNSKSSQYKYFSQGIINDVKTSHLGLFYEEINRRKHTLIKRAAFRIFQEPSPIASLLYLSEIYAPLILDREYDGLFNGDGRLRLYLIGFSFQSKLMMKEGVVKEVVDLDYSNPDDFGRFVDGLKLDDLKNNFKDSYIKDSDFRFEKVSMKKSNIETITVQIETKYLKEKFKTLKNKMVKEMKKNYTQQ